MHSDLVGGPTSGVSARGPFPDLFRTLRRFGKPLLEAFPFPVVVETLRGEPNLFLRSIRWSVPNQKLQQINESRVRISYKSVSKKYLILPVIGHGVEITPFVKYKYHLLKTQITFDPRKLSAQNLLK